MDHGMIAGIFTDEIVLTAIIITIVGIGLKTLFVLLEKGKSAYDFRMTCASLILGFLVSLQLVVTSLNVIPLELPASTHLVIIVGEILTVIGVDSGAKRIGKKFKLIREAKKESGFKESALD